MANNYPHLVHGAPQALLQEIGSCREPTCPVVQRHPFYPTPNQPPHYYGPRPCNPVVPTYATMGKVMIIGQFPNCRFGTVTTPTGVVEKFVAVGDINEPFESGRYFDGFSVREYPTADSLQAFYLDPLDLNFTSDVWLTNLVKCYLMKQPAPGQDGRDDIATYETLGWKDAVDPLPEGTYDDYFDVTAVCAPRWLKREIELCQPQLIIALGKRSYRMIHGADNFSQPGNNISFDNIVGVPLMAGVNGGPLDNRAALFANRNVIHLSHPSRLLYDAARLPRHLDSDIPNTLNFWRQVGRGRFDLFQNDAGEYFFQLRTADEDIILHSEGYIAKAGALNGVNSVRTNGPLPGRYVATILPDGKFSFNLRAANGHVVGSGGSFATAVARDQAILQVQQTAPLATLNDIT